MDSIASSVAGLMTPASRWTAGRPTSRRCRTPERAPPCLLDRATGARRPAAPNLAPSRTVLGASRRCRPAGQVRQGQRRAPGSRDVSASRRSSAGARRRVGELDRGPVAAPRLRPARPGEEVRLRRRQQPERRQPGASSSSRARPASGPSRIPTAMAVQLHDGRRRGREQLVVEGRLGPTRPRCGLCGRVDSAMAACRTYGPRPRAARSSWPACDLGSPPPPAILLLDRQELAPGPRRASRRSAATSGARAPRASDSVGISSTSCRARPIAVDANAVSAADEYPWLKTR